MKTKAIVSVIVALILISSIAAAGPFDFMANMFYKQVDPQANAAVDKSAVAAAQKCTANADCGTGTCTSCKCVATNALTGNALAINLPPSTLIKTGAQAKASSGTLITPKASGTAGALGAADTTINTCLTECKARCKTDCGSNAITGKAIVLSQLKTPTSTLTVPTGIVATTNLANGAVCTTASQCISKICSTQLATVTAPAKRLCSATCKASTECETGKTCSAGKCIIGLTTANRSTSLKTSNLTGNLTAPPRSNTTGSSAPAPATLPSATANKECISACEAKCETTCKASSTPAKIADGAACNNPAHCENQCSSKTFECFCEGSAKASAGGLAQKKESETCDANPQCVSNYCDKVFPDRHGICAVQGKTGDKKIGEECGANSQCQTGRCQLMASSRILRASKGPDAACAEPLEKDIENGKPCYMHSQCQSNYCERATADAGLCAEAKATAGAYNLAPLEAKMAAFERKAIADGIVTAAEIENLKLNYETLSNDKKLENLEARYNFIIDSIVKDETLTETQKTEFKNAKTKKQEAKQQITEVAPAAPKANVGFFKQLGNLFTGKAVFITGYAAAPSEELAESSRNSADKTSSTIDSPPTSADIAGYKNSVKTMDTDLLSIETRICNKLKEAGFNLNRGPECTIDSNCGTTGLMKCQTGVAGKSYCMFSLNAVCPETTLKPSGARLFSECNLAKECASGICSLRSATPDMPMNFCWCAENQDCIEGTACDIETGVCASTEDASGGASTPPPLAPAITIKPAETFLTKIKNTFIGVRI